LLEGNIGRRRSEVRDQKAEGRAYGCLRSVLTDLRSVSLEERVA
jgi:hypothetical protein